MSIHPINSMSERNTSFNAFLICQKQPLSLLYYVYMYR